VVVSVVAVTNDDGDDNGDGRWYLPTIPVTIRLSPTRLEVHYHPRVLANVCLLLFLQVAAVAVAVPGGAGIPWHVSNDRHGLVHGESLPPRV